METATNTTTTTTETTNNGGKGAETEAVKKSNRDTFMERFKQDYPDDNADDEESFYGRMNERTKDYDRLKKNDDNFRKLVNEHPEYGAMVTDMMDGRNFIESLLSRYSEDDIIAAYHDPDMAERIAKEHTEWIKSKEDGKKLNEERDANVQKSIKTLNAYCEKNGIDEETATELWGKSLDYIEAALKLDLDENFFDMIHKGMTHDDDVANARHEGELAGHNAKVQTQLAKGRRPQGIPPTFDGGQGAAATEPKPKNKKVVRNPFRNEDMEFEE